MDLPQKHSSRYVSIIYAIFLILFVFTVSLFYITRCQKSSRLTNQEDSVLTSKDFSENIKKEPDKFLSTKEQAQNKVGPFKINNITDETLNNQPSKKVFSNENKSNIDDLKTSPSEASNQSINSVRPKSPQISSEQKAVIYFSTDSTGLTDDALKKLKTIHEFLLKHPDEELIIEGYGDSGKNNQMNEKLSQIRSEIVKSYFVKQGISDSKIKVFWMGMENPEREEDPQEKVDKNHQVAIKFKSRSNSGLRK